MTIKNFDAQLTLIDGTPVTNGDKPVLLREEIVALLCAAFPDEQNLSGATKFERGLLATKIRDGGDIDLKTEELAMLKTVVGKGSVPFVFQVYNILDGE